MQDLHNQALRMQHDLWHFAALQSVVDIPIVVDITVIHLHVHAYLACCYCTVMLTFKLICIHLCLWFLTGPAAFCEWPEHTNHTQEPDVPSWSCPMSYNPRNTVPVEQPQHTTFSLPCKQHNAMLSACSSMSKHTIADFLSCKQVGNKLYLECSSRCQHATV